MPGFAHLHVHSEYSLLDGLARVPDLVAAARERGFDSLALTDHGVMFGTIRFYRAAKKVGIKPIIGCELYVARRTRHDRESRHDARSHHLTVLAQNDVGYRNLVALASLAQLEGFYYRPRVDRELLERHSDGLVVLSGCPSSEVARLLRDGQRDQAREVVAWYRDVFPGRYYVEVQSHDLDFLPELNRQLVEVAGEFALPLVATNDVHYALPQDATAHDVLLCVQTGTTTTNPDRMRYGNTFYLRTEEEMRVLFGEIPDAVDNTVRIADACHVDFNFHEYKLPLFDVPEGHSAASYLRALCDEGLAQRYPDAAAEVRQRLDYELSVIHEMGFDDYFLIVWDLCRFAREQGIWWNVRGSGAGALVSYCLKITNLDPLAHNLIFERFLNPSRVSMPDIDLDFPDDQRDEVIRYTYERYGHDRVAQIITFGTMGARAAIRDAGRALDMPLSLVDQVARLVPAIPGKPCKLGDALRSPTADDTNEFYSPDLAAMAQEPDVGRLLDAAQSLEGVARHASTHAAGVVIADRPLMDYLPLHRPTSSADGALPLTQFAMKDVESLGLLKVDFLGLSTLTVLRRAAELVERAHGVHYALDSIPLDDPGIYELLSSGEVTGVFQVEGAGMRRTLRDMRPTRFEHVMAAIALFRPGPMDYIPRYIARMHGQEPVTYRHPRLKEILEETFGIIVYQEQIIQVAQELAGYNAGEADTIRKAVGKKNKADLLAHREQFIQGATGNDIDADTAEGIWHDIETFARYGFNKAHAADYAVIVCQTAYFKAHYPVEYMAALLSVERNNTDKVGYIIADCRRLGIELLPPSVNSSGVDFAIEAVPPGAAPADGASGGEEHQGRGIRYGLAAVKNVGQGAVEAILAGRGDQPFRDLEDFCRRADLRDVGKRPLESLVKVGALGTFGSRAGLLDILDRVLAFSASHHDAADRGQLSLFGGAGAPQESALLGPVPRLATDEGSALAWEKELIGHYISEHPLHRAAAELAEEVTATIGDIDEAMQGEEVTVAGMVADVRRITTRKGAAMAFARLDDLQASIDVTIFPSIYEATRSLWHDDRIVLVRGKVELRNDRLQLLVDDAWECPAADGDPVANGEDLGADGPPAPPAAGDAPGPETPAPEQEQVPPDPGVTSAAEGGSEAPGAPRSYHLTITLPRTGDVDADVALLKQVYDLLRGYEGRDRFALRVPNGAGLVELDFPNSNTRYCLALARRVEDLVGAGRLQAGPG